MAGIDNNTLLYLRGDSLKDLSSYSRTVSGDSNILSNGTYKIDNGMTPITVSSFALGSNWTMEFFANENTSDMSSFVEKGYYTTGINGGYTFRWIAPSSGRYGFELWTSNGTSLTYPFQNTYLYLNPTFSHYAITYSSGTIKFYIDGVLKLTKSYTFNFDQNTSPYIFSKSDNIVLKHIRFSNVVRYTSDFTPPSINDAFTSVSVSDIELAELENRNVNLACNVNKLSTNETVRVDIIINNKVIKTYTSDYENISYEISKSSLSYGNNNIEVRAYYYNDNYKSSSVEYLRELNLEEFEPLEILPGTASLSSLMQHMSKINNAINAMLNNLKTLLEDKGFDVGDNPKLNVLIKLVKELSNDNSTEITEYINQITQLNSTIENNTQLLYNKLVEKNLNGITNTSSFQELINAIDECDIYPRLYLYKSGDECTNITGGWETYKDSRATVTFTKSPELYILNNSQGGSTTEWKGYFFAKNLINLTNYNYLCMEITSFYGGSYTAGSCAYRVVVTNTKDYKIEDPQFSMQDKNIGVQKYPIANLTSGYIGFRAYCFGSYIKIKNIWLE